MSENLTTVVSSKNKSVEINRSNPTVIIGERINPTGRKSLLAELKEGKFDIVKRDAVAQVEAGAAIIDVNAGVPGADEEPLMREMMKAVMEVTDAPQLPSAWTMTESLPLPMTASKLPPK